MPSGLEPLSENELEAIGVCLAYVDAQVLYASKDRDGDGVKSYAQRLVSTPGTQDGRTRDTWTPSAGFGSATSSFAVGNFGGGGGQAPPAQGGPSEFTRMISVPKDPKASAPAPAPPPAPAEQGIARAS